MKKYISFFVIRFSMGLQYRAAALAGVVTQFAWGMMEIMIYTAFYQTDAAAFPMTMAATASYIWLQQSFLCLFMSWLTDWDILNAIRDGGIAYELCRPVDIYFMWFAKSMSNRLSGVVLRCLPILVVAFIVPAPYGLSLPAGIDSFVMFVITLILGLLVMVSITMLVYVLNFYMISPQGLQIFSVALIDFLSGGVIPIPFFPERMRRVLEFLPFGSAQNIPFRVYSGDIQGRMVAQVVFIQIFWIVVLVCTGKILCGIALRRVKVQGG